LQQIHPLAYVRPYLGNKFRLLELSIDQNHIAMFIDFCTAEAGFRGRFGRERSSVVENGRVVIKLVMVWKVIGLQGLIVLLS
jgi:hypothetical protein